MKWIKIFDAGILSSADFIKLVRVAGKKLCIVKMGQDIFAVQNKCPHAGADLSEGWCDKGNLVCPYHRHEFNLETGSGAPGQGDYINTYPVETRADGIYVGIKEPWWKF